jgi:hypothetical protein
MSFTVDAITMTAAGTTRGRRIGEFPTHDEAVAAARQIIDAFLYREYRRGVAHGATAEKLLALYKRVGEKPLVFRKSETSTIVSQFDHLEYAAKRCAEICRSKPAA